VHGAAQGSSCCLEVVVWQVANYGTIHRLGGGDADLKVAYSTFERSLRLHLYELMHEEPAGGVGEG
jgi:hypothetical protein